MEAAGLAQRRERDIASGFGVVQVPQLYESRPGPAKPRGAFGRRQGAPIFQHTSSGSQRGVVPELCRHRRFDGAGGERDQIGLRTREGREAQPPFGRHRAVVLSEYTPATAVVMFLLCPPGCATELSRRVWRFSVLPGLAVGQRVRCLCLLEWTGWYPALPSIVLE